MEINTQDIDRSERESIPFEKVKTDGSLIPLKKQIADKNLSLMIRYITFPFIEMDPRMKKSPNKAYLLLNVFGEDTHGKAPMGYLDWEITDGIARTNHSQALIIPNSPEAVEAKKMYGDDYRLTSFFLEPSLQGQGLGTFLRSISLAVFEKQGISSVLTGSKMSEPAKNVWKKLGVDIATHGESPIPVTDIMKNQSVTKSITSFI